MHGPHPRKLHPGGHIPKKRKRSKPKKKKKASSHGKPHKSDHRLEPVRR